MPNRFAGGLRAMTFAAIVAVLCGASSDDSGGAQSMSEQSSRHEPGEPSVRKSRGFHRAPCAPSSPRYQEAVEALNRLDRRVRDLDHSPESLEQVTRELSALLELPCFGMSVENPRSVVPTSAISLKTWWNDGGEAWLRSYLRLGGSNGPRSIVIPPDLRTPLRIADDGIKAIACAPGDRECGSETEAWRLRAAEGIPAEREKAPGGGAEDESERWCAPPTPEEEGGYLRWRRCLEQERGVEAALPLGATKAPKTGWLMLRGRRGHYGFCDEIRHYDLATGAAFIAQSCSALALRTDGSVDMGATDDGRRVRVRIGRLPVDRLREAVWMLVLMPQVERVQTKAESWEVPSGVAIEWSTASGMGIGLGGGWFSTAQTRLEWEWRTGDRLLSQGALTWPNSHREGESYAATLLRIAEEGFNEDPSVSTADLPPWLLARDVDAPGVSHLDGTPEGIRETHRRLETELRKHVRAGESAR